MNWEKYLEIMHVLEKLKNQTRHSYTSAGRHESAAEHSWRLCAMAYFIKDRYKETDISKIILMCLFHDIGEIFTGDIPAFEKTSSDEDMEKQCIDNWIASIPDEYRMEMTALFQEMRAQNSPEAKLYLALDKLEAVIQHNESDIRTWLPLEYELQKTYGSEAVSFDEELKKLRQLLVYNTEDKIAQAKKAGYVNTNVTNLNTPVTNINTPDTMGIIRLVLGDCFTNCYLVFDKKTKDTILIDPADNAEQIITTVEKEQLNIRYIFITHGHTDHVLALSSVKDAFNVPVIVSKIDAWRLMDEELINERPYVCTPYTAVRPDILLSDDDCLNLGSLQFTAKLLPGHTEGSMALICGQTVFPGDIIMINGHGKTSLPGGSDEKMQQSLAYIKENWQGYTVYPGHKEIFTIKK